MKKESHLQIAVISYIRHSGILKKYPNAVMIVDPLKDSITGPDVGRLMIAAEKRGFEKGLPDLIIIAAVGAYTGFALEFKNEYSDVFNKNGTLKKKMIYKNTKYGRVPNYDHNELQHRKLMQLRSNGFYAEYGFGYEDSIAHLNHFFYMNTYEPQRPRPILEKHK